MPETVAVAPALPAWRMMRGFIRMPLGDKALMVLAWCLLGCAALFLRLVAFRHLVPLLGKPIGAVGFVPLANQIQTARAYRVRLAILRAARLAPFRSDCLPQAFAAAILCRMLGVPASVHLGVKLNVAPKPMAAHAWVCSGREAVTGGRSFGAYTPVSCFLFSPA